ELCQERATETPLVGTTWAPTAGAIRTGRVGGSFAGTLATRAFEMLVEQAVEQLDVDVQITVDDDVAKAGDNPKLAGEGRRQDSHLAESIDRGGVVGYVVAAARGEVDRHVEGVLGTELESPFHDPELLRIGELIHPATLVAAEDLQGGVQGQQVATGDGG